MSESHEPNVQHHYRDMSQQHEAAKLGIWLFLATEVLLFGGLFCGYAVFRANQPELFKWGEQFLDERYGAANTAVLLISSLTMAMAITYVQREKRRMAALALGITFICACIFMAIKSVEYQHKFHEHLVGGIGFYQVSDHEGGSGGGSAAEMSGNALTGAALWDVSCRSCHGPKGEGIPGQGTVLNTSEYVLGHTDATLVAFVKVGRPANDPDSVLQLEMPPNGGNPMLNEQGLYDIIAYVRTWQITLDDTENALVGDGDMSETVVEEVNETAQLPPPAAVNISFIDSLPKSTVQHPMDAPSGLAPESASEAQRMAVLVRPEVPQLDENRPANAHLFFGLYFLMTGLHGIHVLVGMVLILWLMWRLHRGDFNKRYYAAVECGGLYWHIVDVIWIFLFPLWYLIG